ncbi:MAG: bifunctional diguanylate cyclase/phosphodiesterase [Lachnoclostridium sp.]|nr:bifunctional diguanylate cyclase/phosphodiesterase [Lachnoclostridium sp.]
MDFSIKMEVVSLVILVILAMFHFDRQNSSNTRYRLYSVSLICTVLTVVFDIGSTLAMRAGELCPVWLAITLNTAYFIALDSAFSIIAIYCFYIMFEHSVDRHCYQIASKVIMVFAALLLLINLLNLRFGWVFTFESGQYERGPYNQIGYIPLFIEVGMFCFCYLRNRTVIGTSMKRLVQTLPTLVLLMTIIQALSPNFILTGTLASIVCMVLFINFQSSRNGRDALTGLPSRLNFMSEIRAHRKRGENVHLIMVYLDRFEEVNKRFGAKMGDAVLISISAFLEKKMNGYQVCRFGNTTFLLMAKSGGREKDIQYVKRLKKRFESPWIQGDKEALVCASIAHRVADFSGYDEIVAVDQLEYALNVARESGGNHVICFDGELKKQYMRKEHVLERVKDAIKNQSFEVYFQPLYNSKDNQFDTAESLIRLKDLDGSFISPAEFIPLAEKYGLMDDISRQVMNQVCSFLGTYPDLCLKQISVNIPVGQLLDLRLSDWIDDVCRTYRVPAERLRLEITERAMTDQPERVRTVMQSISEKGVKFYLDDFGIGYSNLSMMMELPFETVKLDASLLSKMTNGEKEYRTMQLLVDMLHNAGFQVVAEGIETVEQMQAARKLQIDRIQGFYYARPMSAKDTVEFLAVRNGNQKKES